MRALNTAFPITLGAPEEGEFRLDQAEKIASGNDSVVLALGGFVYKEYFRLKLEQVLEYSQLMNDAVPIIDQLAYSGSIGIQFQQFTFTCKGLPVERVFMGPNLRPVAVSRYIPEPNLDRLLQSPALYAGYPSQRISSEEARAFFVRLNQLFAHEMPTRVQDEFLYHVDMLSRQLDRGLGVSGIYIGKYNTKIIPDLQRNHLILLITDLSVYIDRLRMDGRQQEGRG